MIDWLATFVFFFAVIDPVGTVPVFIAVTSDIDAAARRGVALRAAVIAALILLFFIVAGELILDAIGIPLPAFQVAGGIVLFLFALTMIFGDGKPEEELKLANAVNEKAVFPLAVPSIASPGAMMAAVLLTENRSHTVFQQSQTALVMLSVLVIVYILMLIAGPIQRVIGNTGASVVSRVMGLILASVAMAAVLEGITLYFGLS